jgi:Bacterial PH domain
MPRTAGVVMQFRPLVRATSVLLLVVAAAAGLMVSARHRGAEAGALEVFLALAVLLLGAGAVEVLGVAHRLAPDGIERVAPGRKRTLVRWSDVVGIDWIATTRWYELTSRDGERVRVYQQLSGLPSFARAALDGIPAEVVDARRGLRRQLEQASRGVAPPDDSEREEWRGG